MANNGKIKRINLLTSRYEGTHCEFTIKAKLKESQNSRRHSLGLRMQNRPSFSQGRCFTCPNCSKQENVENKACAKTSINTESGSSMQKSVLFPECTTSMQRVVSLRSYFLYNGFLKSPESDDDPDEILEGHISQTWTEKMDYKDNSSFSSKREDVQYSLSDSELGSVNRNTQINSHISPDSGFGEKSASSSQNSVSNSLESNMEELQNSLLNHKEISVSCSDIYSRDIGEFCYGAPDALASYKSSFVMSSWHKYYSRRQAPYNFSFSNDSYAFTEKKRIRELKEALKRKINSSWLRSTEAEKKSEISRPRETVVLCMFSDEPMPYRMKLKGDAVSLGKFKEAMPKRGHYRYFFEIFNEELNSSVWQEYTEDEQIIPYLEGKINARIMMKGS